MFAGFEFYDPERFCIDKYRNSVASFLQGTEGTVQLSLDKAWCLVLNNPTRLIFLQLPEGRRKLLALMSNVSEHACLRRADKKPSISWLTDLKAAVYLYKHLGFFMSLLLEMNRSFSFSADCRDLLMLGLPEDFAQLTMSAQIDCLREAIARAESNMPPELLWALEDVFTKLKAMAGRLKTGQVIPWKNGLKSKRVKVKLK